MNKEQEEIRQFVAERGIKSVLHFSPVQNLPSILERGLLPRARLVEDAIEFLPTDSFRYDGRLDASCTSLSFPNYKMFYAKRMGMVEVKVWVVLVIDPSVLWELPCLFLPDNAASHKSELCQNPRKFFGVKALASSFDESVAPRHQRLHKRYTTNPQAEVLIFDQVLPTKIRSVLVEEERVRQRIVNWLPEKLQKSNLVVAQDAFAPRFDYDYWR